MQAYTGQYLKPGDKVICESGRKIIKGTIVGKGRTKYKMLSEDGMQYSVPTCIITHYEAGNPADIPATRSNFFGNAKNFAGCSVGDIVLFHRGGKLFDVMKLTSITPLLGRLMGVEHGSVYRLKEDMFVQKLDKACFRESE